MKKEKMVCFGQHVLFNCTIFSLVCVRTVCKPVGMCVCWGYKPECNAHLLEQWTAGIVSHTPSDRSLVSMMQFSVNNTRKKVCVCACVRACVRVCVCVFLH